MSDSTTRNAIEGTLTRAFRDSMYLHSVGSGDVQAIDNLLEERYNLDLEDELRPVLAGAISARAMISVITAFDHADALIEFLEMIEDGSYAE